MKSRSVLRRLREHPRGAAAVLIAFLLPVFVGFLALSVDTAVISTARGQLSTAADAAALAAAMQLASENRVRGATDLTTEITAANAQAATLANANRVLGQPVLLNQNVANASSGEVVVGYLDPSNPSASLLTDSGHTSVFNSAQVTAQRNADHTGVVPTFFASLMGFRGTSISLRSTAMAELYQISGFKSSNGMSANLLPIVLDVTTYQNMLAGTTTDQYTFNAATKTVTAGADGVTESKLYPVSSGSPGNWGTIKVGVANNSTAILGAQIRYGITPEQLATFPNGQITLSPSTTPPSIIFEGNPGISAGIKDDLTSIIGKPVSIPIYDQNGGNGNNAWYRVIAFAPVRLLSVNFQGNPKYVIIQPAILNDPTVIVGGPQTSWTDGGQIKLHLVR